MMIAGPMNARLIEAALPRGTCPIHLFGPEDARSAPAILLFADAFGPRPASFALGEALAAEGWRVVMPDNFYEHTPYEPLTPASLFGGPDGQARLMKLYGSITQEKIDADVAALLDFGTARFGADAPLAAIGYCMGGRYALTAACASPRVRFAAAIHGSRLAPVDEDGAHRRFADAEGRIYVGVAGMDPTYDAAEHGRLAEALRAADADHVIETYQGAAHGFVFTDLPVHDATAAARHVRAIRHHVAELCRA